MNSVSAVHAPPPPQPVQPVQPVQPRDSDGDNDGSSPVQSANPPGVGTQVDITA